MSKQSLKLLELNCFMEDIYKDCFWWPPVFIQSRIVMYCLLKNSVSFKFYLVDVLVRILLLWKDTFQGKSYKGKHLIGTGLQFQRFSSISIGIKSDHVFVRRNVGFGDFVKQWNTFKWDLMGSTNRSIEDTGPGADWIMVGLAQDFRGDEF